MQDMLEDCRLKRFFECKTTGVTGGRGMCSTHERSEILIGFGVKSEIKKHLKKLGVRVL
jgi:hypothetical protein